MGSQAVPTGFKCEVARVESPGNGSVTCLVNPSHPSSIRFASVTKALEAASRDASRRASATDYKVWPNGWGSGETPDSYRFLPDGRRVEDD